MDSRGVPLERQSGGLDMLPNKLEHRRASKLAKELITKNLTLALCRSCLDVNIEFEEPPFDRVVHWVREMVREARHERLT